MSAFDDLTLGEVEELTNVAFNGKSMDEADPLLVAGGVMWLTKRKTQPGLSWDEFKATVRMGDIKSFAMDMEAEDELADPTNVHASPVN